MSPAQTRLAQLALIGILQGVAVALLFGEQTEVLDPLTTSAQGPFNEQRLAFAVVTLLLIAIVSYMFLIEILSTDWHFHLGQVLLWFLLTGAEFVAAMKADEPSIWFGAFLALGGLGAFGYFLNWRWSSSGKRTAQRQRFRQMLVMMLLAAAMGALGLASELEKEHGVHSLAQAVALLEKKQAMAPR